MYLITESEKMLCKEIVDAAYNVHTALGPGLLEKVYETCFCFELQKKNIVFERQICIPVSYQGMIFQDSLRVDDLVDN